MKIQTEVAFSNILFLLIAGSPSPSATYVQQGNYSPPRRLEISTPPESTGNRFSYWPDGKYVFCLMLKYNGIPIYYYI